jgi:hypothetical protein
VASELQRLVDHLGNRLGRSVAIDDPDIRLLAYNAHTADVDDARVGSIMRRSVPSALTGYLDELGIQHAEDVFTVPARPDIGLAVERIGMPVRYGRTLLGYLWLVRSDGPVTAEHAEAMREGAGRAALILHREYLLGELARGQERELLRDLLADDASLRVEAAARLVEEELVAAGPMAALVATLSRDVDEPFGERDRLALAAAVDHGRRRLSPRSALALQRPDHALLVAVWPGAGDDSVDKHTAELAGVVHERLVAESGRAAGACWVGIGNARRSLAELRQSYHEARRAADVARVTGALGQVAAYQNLGVYALLAQLSPADLANALHPGIRPLLTAGGHDDLVETLTAYLDNAGDAKRTVAQLHVHRATLYYRLHRIEELSNLDLSRGDDRLAAHLSLKLARLIEPT